MGRGPGFGLVGVLRWMLIFFHAYHSNQSFHHLMHKLISQSYVRTGVLNFLNADKIKRVGFECPTTLRSQEVPSGVRGRGASISSRRATRSNRGLFLEPRVTRWVPSRNIASSPSLSVSGLSNYK